MRFYEATEKDAAKLARFIERELRAAGFKSTTTAADVRDNFNQGRRYVYGMDDVGKVQALLSVHPARKDRKFAYHVRLFLISRDYPDKMRGFDELCLFGCNLLASEGVGHVFGHVPLDPARYAQSTLMLDAAAMVGKPGVIEVSQAPQWIISDIFRRRPEWQTSL